MQIRNVAIIAHVDHGKTTLVDALLKQSEKFKLKSGETGELIMDSNELEKERGITIFSKNASVVFEGTKINIVDTPGHADFGGEVERIMRMVDGALLLVDAKEGPMPQTKFVLKKAIEAGHKIIVIINKIDKPDARCDYVLDKTFDLFIELGASDEQTNFPVLYAASREGKAGGTADLSVMADITPVFRAIIEKIPAPVTNDAGALQMLTVNLGYDSYKGKIAIGRLYAGVLKKGMQVSHIDRAGKVKPASITSVMLFSGMDRIDADEARSGDIAAIAGIPDISIGETISDLKDPKPLPTIEIESPTIKMTFAVNKSPFGGREGKLVTSRNIKERLGHELETDVALKVKAIGDTWEVSGRGELHLAILLEKMRREGFELEVSRPEVIMKEEGGRKLEPIELVSIEVPEEFSGMVIEEMGKRAGQMRDMRIDAPNAFMDFAVPTRGLIGFRSQFLTMTRGRGILHSLFLAYEPVRGDLSVEPHGSIVVHEAGVATTYGLINAQSRGQLFIGPQTEVYRGMVVGQNAKPEDVRVNVCKEKKLTNMRAAASEDAEYLDVPRQMGLEDALEYIGDDELVEITPRSIRLRKKELGGR
ncbi:MAG: translational GTPase TypA [Candidatus Sungbacteria bacterium]|uniref:50S ribosomal subunit assembly factor BipA n=1 Tax=Candidatus Sungiibacteriota bacterium TaxID=2750080 RepID=A0A9D6QUA3_9BACT|nr:translational GTPase TypA [Candidatus Sungbacteria bacterium]